MQEPIFRTYGRVCLGFLTVPRAYIQAPILGTENYIHSSKSVPKAFIQAPMLVSEDYILASRAVSRPNIEAPIAVP